MDYQQTIVNTALADGMPLPLAQLIAAQGAHESGNFTSAIFQDCNNAFGYKFVNNSCTLHPLYESYDSIVDSTHEVTGWILRRLNEGNFPDLSTITTPDEYANALKSNGYFDDSATNYANGIASYLNIALTGTTIPFLLIAAAIAAFVWIYKKNFFS